MAVILKDHNLAYLAVPKVACTSLKMAFFEVENGFAFRNMKINGKRKYIHTFHPTVPFQHLDLAPLEPLECIAVVRDPVSRFISAYTNRVLHHGALDWWAHREGLDREGLAPRPGFEEYLDYFEAYRRASRDVRHHTDPMHHFLGLDPAFFHKIYKMSELDALCQFVATRTDTPFELPKNQVSVVKMSKSDLSGPQIRKIEDFYRRDYDIFGQYL